MANKVRAEWRAAKKNFKKAHEKIYDDIDGNYDKSLNDLRKILNEGIRFYRTFEQGFGPSLDKCIKQHKKFRKSKKEEDADGLLRLLMATQKIWKNYNSAYEKFEKNLKVMEEYTEENFESRADLRGPLKGALENMKWKLQQLEVVLNTGSLW